MTNGLPNGGPVDPAVASASGGEANHRLAAVVSVDVVGYSRLMELDEAGTHEAMTVFRRGTVEPLIARYHGRIVKLTGDGALLEFASAVDAVRCSFEIQQQAEIWNAERPEDRRIVFRVGINLGEVIVDEHDIYGTGVIVAARLQAMCDPGAIFVSSTIVGQVGNRGGLGFAYVGERAVKNIAEPVEVYRVIADAGVGTTLPRRRLRSRRKLLTLGALPLVLLLALFGAWRFNLVGVGEVRMPASKASIAVMPFRNLSADVAQDYFAEGINEDLITDLAKFPGLYVASRSASNYYKDKSASLQLVSSDLGVNYVLEGGIQKSDNAVRITVQLIDAVSGENLWAERYDRNPERIFEIQDEITKTIAGTLMGTTGLLAEAELRRLARKPANNWMAYDYLMQGWHEWYKFTPESNKEARRLFEVARKADPTYARAYASLAWTYALDYEYEWTDRYEETVAQALALSKKALELDEKDYRSYWVLGWSYLYSWQHEQAEAAYNKARQMNPSDTELMAEMASLLIYVGRPQQAIEQLQEAMRRNPFYDRWYVEYLGWAYQEADMAKECVDTMKIVDPEPVQRDLWLLRILAACYADPAVNDMEQAHAVAAKILALDPDFSLAAHRKFQEETFPYESPELVDKWIAALQRVGLPP
jgi:adenylate cyclase